MRNPFRRQRTPGTETKPAVASLFSCDKLYDEMGHIEQWITLVRHERERGTFGDWALAEDGLEVLRYHLDSCMQEK